jgi:glyoxylase-like metal-dependent hydrolase (beta-lactamase superfamily II)
MVDWIRSKSTKPIKAVIVCSDHGDHTGGNAGFPDAPTFYAHPTSKKVLETAGKPPFPAEEVAQRRTLNLGGREIQMVFLGRAHTGGDLSVYLPKERILFMSEAYLHWIFPAMRSAYPTEWVQAIRNAEAMNASWYIPGHGFVDDEKTLKADLPAYRHAVEQVNAEARRLHDAHVPCERGACEAIQKGNWGDLKNWTLYSTQLETAIRRVYDELDGKLP